MLSPSCNIIIRAQSQCGGRPCYSCPRVSIHKEHKMKTLPNHDSTKVAVSKHFAVHLTHSEFENFKMALQPINATLDFMDNQEAVTTYFSTLDISGDTRRQAGASEEEEEQYA